LDSSGSGRVPMAGSSEYINEPLGFIKGEELLDELSDCQLLKDCAPWGRFRR
jgi:hypothetical protein